MDHILPCVEQSSSPPLNLTSTHSEMVATPQPTLRNRRVAIDDVPAVLDLSLNFRILSSPQTVVDTRTTSVTDDDINESLEDCTARLYAYPHTSTGKGMYASTPHPSRLEFSDSAALARSRSDACTDTTLHPCASTTEVSGHDYKITRASSCSHQEQCAHTETRYVFVKGTWRLQRTVVVDVDV